MIKKHNTYNIMFSYWNYETELENCGFVGKLEIKEEKLRNEKIKCFWSRILKPEGYSLNPPGLRGIDPP